MAKLRRNLSGFTLVELSIVIAIIGLLVGTVTGGMAVLKNVRYRRILTEARNYQIAMEQFKQKYEYYPGDFPLATRVWGAIATCSYTAASTDKTTCNGNGDGYIGAGGTPTTWEGARMWQHLNNAGLITAGNYTGAGSLAAYTAYTSIGTRTLVGYILVPGTNVPNGPLDNSAFSVIGMATASTTNGVVTTTTPIVLATSSRLFPGDYGNGLVFSGAGSTPMDTIPILTPARASLLDTKADDGNPAYGNIRAQNTAYSGCTTSYDPTTAAYVASDDSKVACMLYFMQPNSGYRVQ